MKEQAVPVHHTALSYWSHLCCSRESSPAPGQSCLCPCSLEDRQRGLWDHLVLKGNIYSSSLADVARLFLVSALTWCILSDLIQDGSPRT